MRILYTVLLLNVAVIALPLPTYAAGKDLVSVARSRCSKLKGAFIYMKSKKSLCEYGNGINRKGCQGGYSTNVGSTQGRYKIDVSFYESRKFVGKGVYRWQSKGGAQIGRNANQSSGSLSAYLQVSHAHFKYDKKHAYCVVSGFVIKPNSRKRGYIRNAKLTYNKGVSFCSWSVNSKVRSYHGGGNILLKYSNLSKPFDLKVTQKCRRSKKTKWRHNWVYNIQPNGDSCRKIRLATCPKMKRNRRGIAQMLRVEINTKNIGRKGRHKQWKKTFIKQGKSKVRQVREIAINKLKPIS